MHRQTRDHRRVDRPGSRANVTCRGRGLDTDVNRSNGQTLTLTLNPKPHGEKPTTSNELTSDAQTPAVVDEAARVGCLGSRTNVAGAERGGDGTEGD